MDESAAFESERADQRVFVLPRGMLVWLGLALVAIGLRLGALDAVPLSPAEASRALEGRAILRGAHQDYTAGPLLPNVLAVWLGLFTVADGPARAPGALAGAALCFAPWLFRSFIGRRAALWSCSLLAFSPVGVLASRSVDPAVFVLLALATALGCVLLAFHHDDGRYLIGTGVATAAGLAASPAFVGQAAALLLAAGLAAPLRSESAPNVRAWAARAGAIALGAALVIDTLLLMRPIGLQAGLIDPLPAWLISLGASPTTVLSTALLLIHEIPLLVVAAASAPVALRSPFGRFLCAWVMTSSLVGMLTRAPELGNLAAPTVPLALLGAHGLARLGWLRRGARPPLLLTAVVTLGPVGFLIIATNNTLNRGSNLAPLPPLVALGATVAILLFASTRMTLAELFAALGLVLAALLILLQVAFLNRLNFAGFERGGPALFGQSSRPEMRRVEERARDWWRQNPQAPLRVDASLRPLLEWSLRDGPTIEWLNEPPSSGERAILGGNTAPERPAGTWLRLVVAESYAPADGPAFPQLWRWLVARQSLVRTQPDAILMPQLGSP